MTAKNADITSYRFKVDTKTSVDGAYNLFYVSKVTNI